MVREEATGEHREVSLSLRSSLGPGDEDLDNKGDNNGLFVGKRKSSEASLIGGDFRLLAISLSVEKQWKSSPPCLSSGQCLEKSSTALLERKFAGEYLLLIASHD